MMSDDCPDTEPATGGEPAVCVAARGLVGLTYPDPRYLDAIAPGETPARQLEMGRMSDCALLWRGQNGGKAPYRNGWAFADVWTLAGGSPWAPGGRVREPLAGELPELGDAIAYDRGPGGPEHLDLCWLGDGKAVAGGQRTGDGRETIAIVTRELVWVGDKLIDRLTGRPVLALIVSAS